MSEKILQINFRYNVAKDDYVNAVSGLADFSVRQFGVMKKESNFTRAPLDIAAKA